MLALGVCSPPGAIERQSTQPIRMCHKSALSRTEDEQDDRSKQRRDRTAVPLGDVVSVLTVKRHPVATMGFRCRPSPWSCRTGRRGDRDLRVSQQSDAAFC